jgi:methionine-rich copper-binding protein CopC
MSRRHSQWAGVAGLLASAALLAGSVATSAFAHARPAAVSPGDGAVLSAAPSVVTLTTSEEVSHNATDNSLALLASDGSTVASGYTVDSAHTTMTLTVPAGLAVGEYTVRWVTTSADDGDAATGTWSFTYDPSKPASAGSSDPADHGSDVEPSETPVATPTTPAATATATTSATPSAVATTPAATSTAAASATATATKAAPAAPAAGTGLASSSSSLAPWLALSGMVALAASTAALYASRRRQ